MAHSSSSLVHTPSFADAHDGKSQDILPPRKRLLAGLKHVKSPPSIISGSFTSSPAQSLHGEAHVETAYSPPPHPHGLLLHGPTHKCSSCGDVSVLLHRVPCLASGSSYHCSSCVLSSNKKMYCVLCFQVIKEGSLSSSSLASSFLTCCRCQRLTHLNCALKVWSPSLEGAGLTLCKDCYTRNNGQFREPPTKRRKIASVRRSKQAAVSACKVKLPVINMQALTAARIVAVTAKRDAFEAKQRATVLVKAAAHAAVHAKAALDNAYQLSKKKPDKEEHTDVVVNTVHRVTKGVATAKNPRSSKRRALSAIVASEMLARDLTMANRVATIESSEKRGRRTGFDADNAESMLSHDAAGEAATCRAAQSIKMGIKRRKTLSSIGLQHPTKTRVAAISKGSKLSTRKRKGSKGKLGAIVSQVLALSKVSKRSLKASEMVRDSGLPRTIPDDDANNGAQEKAGRMDAIASTTDTTLNDSLLISRGTIASINTCSPSPCGMVTSYDKRVQDRNNDDASTRCTDAMRIDSLGIIQEQLLKGRFGASEAMGYEQEKRLLSFLTKTMPSRKLMYSNGVTSTRVTPKG